MADLTVDGLAELTTPAANDEIGIWDVSAGAFLKIRRDNLVGLNATGSGTIATGGFTLTVPATGTAALRDVANTFTAAQTFASVTIGTSLGGTVVTRPTDGHTLVAVDLVAMGIGAKYTLPSTSGLLIVTSTSAGRSSVYLLSGGAVTVIEQDTNGFSTTMGTANKINIYFNGSFYEIENGFSTVRTGGWMIIGY